MAATARPRSARRRERRWWVGKSRARSGQHRRDCCCAELLEARARRGEPSGRRRTAFRDFVFGFIGASPDFLPRQPRRRAPRCVSQARDERPVRPRLDEPHVHQPRVRGPPAGAVLPPHGGSARQALRLRRRQRPADDGHVRHRAGADGDGRRERRRPAGERDGGGGGGGGRGGRPRRRGPPRRRAGGAVADGGGEGGGSWRCCRSWASSRRRAPSCGRRSTSRVCSS